MVLSMEYTFILSYLVKNFNNFHKLTDKIHIYLSIFRASSTVRASSSCKAKRFKFSSIGLSSLKVISNLGTDGLSSSF